MNMRYTISVVIVTYMRPGDLEKCLKSILLQTYMPSEIFVIDNGRDPDTERLIGQLKEQFHEKAIALEYRRNDRENSLTVAKNIGISHASGGLVSFLDDDVILECDYYEEIVRVFREHPGACGVTGRTQNTQNREFYNILNLLGKFQIGSSFNEKGRMRIFPSLVVSSPDISQEKVVSCQWISGASTFKADTVREIRPDENLKKYSWNEDQDLSYRIFKKYPLSLFITPFARYFHKCSEEGRLSPKEIIYMAEVYDRYLFYKNFNRGLGDSALFTWSRCGRVLLKSLFIIRWGRSGLQEIFMTLDAMIYSMKHREQLKIGDLDFFNRDVLKVN